MLLLLDAVVVSIGKKRKDKDLRDNFNALWLIPTNIYARYDLEFWLWVLIFWADNWSADYHCHGKRLHHYIGFLRLFVFELGSHTGRIDRRTRPPPNAVDYHYRIKTVPVDLAILIVVGTTIVVGAIPRWKACSPAVSTPAWPSGGQDAPVVTCSYELKQSSRAQTLRHTGLEYALWRRR